MKLTPVKSYTAHYPDKGQVDLNGLLLHHRPNRWKTSGTALLLLGALAATQVTGCSSQTTTSPQPATRKMNMAPIFEGVLKEIQNDSFVSGLSFGGQKINIVPLGNFPGLVDLIPLTEEAALVIINAALEEHGLSSSASKKKVDVPIGDNKASKWSFDLNINGAAEPVYAEFLPQAHVESTSGLAQRNALNLPEDAKEAAVALREKLSEVYDDSTGVVFYANNSFFSSTEQQLIEQVNEFVEWLKTMGLI